MLGKRIGQEHMGRTTRRACGALRKRRITRRGKVRYSNQRMRRAPESLGVVIKPIRIRIRVVIDVGYDLTARLLPADVARGAQTSVLRPYDPNVETPGYLR